MMVAQCSALLSLSLSLSLSPSLSLSGEMTTAQGWAFVGMGVQRSNMMMRRDVLGALGVQILEKLRNGSGSLPPVRPLPLLLAWVPYSS
jgi:hypothetical protein